MSEKERERAKKAEDHGYWADLVYNKLFNSDLAHLDITKILYLIKDAFEIKEDPKPPPIVSSPDRTKCLADSCTGQFEITQGNGRKCNRCGLAVIFNSHDGATWSDYASGAIGGRTSYIDKHGKPLNRQQMIKNNVQFIYKNNDSDAKFAKRQIIQAAVSQITTDMSKDLLNQIVDMIIDKNLTFRRDMEQNKPTVGVILYYLRRKYGNKNPDLIIKIADDIGIYYDEILTKGTKYRNEGKFTSEETRKLFDSNFKKYNKNELRVFK